MDVLRTGALVAVLVAVSGCESRTGTDALGEMKAVFVGEWSRQDVKTRMDAVMKLYDLPETETNYNKACCFLVVLAEIIEGDITEMQIADYMIRSHVPGVKMTFREAAVLAAGSLTVGDK